MILAPRYLPRLAATVGLFTRYGLLDFARGQGLPALEHLQDSVEPMALDEVENTIESELGTRIAKLFSTFDAVRSDYDPRERSTR